MQENRYPQPKIWQIQSPQISQSPLSLNGFGILHGRLIKMRTLAPSTSSKIEAYKSSGSPGSRLAAIAMVQMEPDLGDLQWLEDRFSTENPFIFYHAALALKNMTIHANDSRKQEIISIAKNAQAIVERFEYGVPDPDTIEVLSSIR